MLLASAPRRSRPRTDPLPDELDRIEDRNAKGPDTALDSAELYAQIAALPEPFREALVAIDVVGLSYREAARALRVREATITTSFAGPGAGLPTGSGTHLDDRPACPPPLERARARPPAPS